jgi:mannose-6-phosphate isomerase-like protein (cupin superfamily)
MFKLHHGSMPSNMFAFGTQTLPPGGRPGPRAFAAGEAVFFVYAGSGRAMVNQDWRRMGPKTLIYVSRGMPHDIHNNGTIELSFAWVATPPGLDRLVATVGGPREPGNDAPSPFGEPSDAAEICRRAGIIPIDPGSP